MSLLFCSSDGYLCAHLMDEAIKEIKEDIARFHPLETGGILMGFYDSNFRQATIELTVSAPADSVHGYTSFDRGTQGIAEKIAEANQKNPLLHYVGEWHSHPNGNPSPSSTDAWQMQKFALGRHHGAQTPLLLIVGGILPDKLQWHFSVHRLGWLPKHLTLV